MTVADYVAEYLEKIGVTDVFGIPGGVVLPLLYAFDRTPNIAPHLNYHEQMSGFAACGYAQAGKGLGVAYATRGPGIANMVTCIADAWQESLPVLFITAHGSRGTPNNMRYESDQEMDMVPIVETITKYAININQAEVVPEILQMACHMAMHGRKGPVFLDFSTKILKKELFPDDKEKRNVLEDVYDNQTASNAMKCALLKYHRPIILIGDGIRQAGCSNGIKQWLERLRVPVLSSRAAQDIACNLEHYYGYIGSHGLRYSNFILSKADLIIAIGNRLSFPKDSETFSGILRQAHVIRIEIDSTEFQREIPEALNLHIDMRSLVAEWEQGDYSFDDKEGWLDVCYKIKEALNQCDMVDPVIQIAEYMKFQPSDITYVCDVGNNEFWFSRAFEFVRPSAKALYSKSFGTLGSALGRAIGAYYATSQKVVCVMGDQGFQYNIQELQYIAHWKLPVTVLLLNNKSSGMIRDQEGKTYGKHVHVTFESGYAVPDFPKICEGYGIRYVNASTVNRAEKIALIGRNEPLVYEIAFSEIPLTPNIPKGNPCQQMTPLIGKELYKKLDEL